MTSHGQAAVADIGDLEDRRSRAARWMLGGRQWQGLLARLTGKQPGPIAVSWRGTTFRSAKRILTFPGGQ
jgi:hypothetical protein